MKELKESAVNAVSRAVEAKKGGGSLFYRNIDGPRFALLKLRLVGHFVRTQQS